MNYKFNIIFIIPIRRAPRDQILASQASQAASQVASQASLGFKMDSNTQFVVRYPPNRERLEFTILWNKYEDIAILLLLLNGDFTVSLPWTLMLKILNFLPREYVGDNYRVAIGKIYQISQSTPRMSIDRYENCWIQCAKFGQYTYNDCCRSYICIHSPDNYVPVIEDSNPICDSCIFNTQKEENDNYFNDMEDQESMFETYCDCSNYYYGSYGCKHCGD